MSRTDRLYSRLDDLLAEFTDRLARELEAVASGGSSAFLSRMESGPMGLQFLRTPECDYLERLESDIRSLHSKLGEPAQGGPMTVLDEYLARYGQLPDRFDGGAVSLAKKMLAELRAQQNPGVEADRSG